MRVIAGTYRSRPLAAPRGLDTRPTSDRLRETLFNILAPRIEGSALLDLYAGSGAVGIEALSRGAAHVVFAEKTQQAIAAIRANLKSLGIATGFDLHTHSVAASLKKLLQHERRFDIVFLDPPYDDEAEYDRTLNMLGTTAMQLLKEDATVIVEHRRKQKLKENYGALHQYRLLEQGDAALSFYSIK